MTFAKSRRELLKFLWDNGHFGVNPIKEGRYYTAIVGQKFIATHCPRIDSISCEEWARRYGNNGAFL